MVLVKMRFLIAAFSFLLFLTPTAFAMQEEQLRPAAQPLYEQCAARTSTVAAKRVVDAQVARLKSSSPSDRVRAAEELAKSCDARATLPLVTLLKEDKDAGVRAAAANALGHLGDPESIEPLRAAIADPDSRVLFELGPALCAFQNYKASYDTLNMLANPYNRTLTSLSDLAARCQAILSLYQLRDVGFSRKATYFLFSFVVHTDPAYRDMTAATLHEAARTKNGPHELVGVLKQAPNPDFRLKAAYWLGELKIENGRDVLTEVAANDRDPAVKREAQKALAKLGPAKAP